MLWHDAIFLDEKETNDIIIGNDVWIGAYAKVLKGMRIGDGAIIYPGVVVERDVEPFEIYKGHITPTQYRFDEKTIEKILKSQWWRYKPSQKNELSFLDKYNSENVTNRENEELLPKRFYINTNQEMIYSENDGKYYTVFDRKETIIKAGGISLDSPMYDERKKILEIKGWFLPSYAYDKIEIYNGNRKIGNAKLHILRRDVQNNYLEYSDPRAGFEFSGEWIFDDKNFDITVICIKNGKSIYQTTKKSHLFDWKYFLDDFNYKDIEMVLDGIDGFNLELGDDEKEDKTLTTISDIFNTRKKTISLDGRYKKNIVTSINSQFGSDNCISFVELACFKNNLLDYNNLKTISGKTKVDIVEIMRTIKNFFGRKIIAVYGNCQIMSINSILSSSKDFIKKYIILSFPPVHTFGKDEIKNGIDESVLKEIDIFIYQLVAKTNKFSEKLATDVILGQLREGIKTCIIPNVYFMGFFPQYIANKYNSNNLFVNGLFPYGDKNIESMWDEKNAEEIAELIMKDDFYSEKEVNEIFEASFNELVNREKNCNVSISDYIMKNYKQNRCFYTTNHVTNVVLLELVHRFLKYLDCDVDDFDLSKTWENDGREIPIYPSVQKVLKLDYYKEKYCYFRAFKSEPSTLKEYVNDYIKFCKPVCDNMK